jgi:hypothetical protein
MGYRGLLKPKCGPVVAFARWLVSGRIVATASLGCLIAFAAGSGYSLYRWGRVTSWGTLPSWLSGKVPCYSSEQIATLWLPSELLWGRGGSQLDNGDTKVVPLMVCTNGFLVSVCGGLIGWYIGRLRRLRVDRVGDGSGTTPGLQPIWLTWPTAAWREAVWGCCVGLLLISAVLLFLAFHTPGSGGAETGLGAWLSLTRPGLLVCADFGLRATYGSNGGAVAVLSAVITCILFAAVVGLICGAVAALVAPKKTQEPGSKTQESGSHLHFSHLESRNKNKIGPQ